MDIHIRTAKLEDYNAVEAIMKQVHQLHVHWRPDVYRQQETILPLEEFEQAIKEQAFFVAEEEGCIVGILGIDIPPCGNSCSCNKRYYLY